MFEVFIAPEQRRSSLLNSRALAASVLTHAFLFSGVLYASTHLPAVVEEPRDEVVAYMDITDEPVLPRLVKPEPAREAARPSEAPARAEPEEKPVRKEKKERKQVAPPVAGFQELVAPEETPAALPDLAPTLSAARVDDFRGVGIAGGVALGLVNGEWRAVVDDGGWEAGGADGAPVTMEMVQEMPRLVNGAEVQRLLERFYPRVLLEEGVTGQVLLRFVIDARGRVEPSSVRLLSATHDAFGKATTRVVDRLRFRPATVEGRKVPVVVSLPIVWTIREV